MSLAGKRFGDFVLLEQVGGGGSSHVYRSLQPALGRQAAIKVLHASDRRQKTRFEREALLASLIRHPHAAHVYACGSHEDGDWIAMEYVQGITLDDWLQQHGPMPFDQFLPFFDLLADVIRDLHELGIIHRDIKPSNVMVVVRRDQMVPKLLDLGIAKVPPELARSLKLPDDDDEPSVVIDVGAGPVTITGSLTPSRGGMGSMPYMPPEQWTNPKSAVPESDVYALAILAYKALTGRLPFEAATGAEMHACHFHMRPPSIGGELAADLDPVFQRALAKRPEDRHHSTLELASELRQAQKARNARRAIRLRRLVLGLSAALAVALLLGGVSFLLQDRAQAQIAEEQASSARRKNEALETQREADRGQCSLLANKRDAAAHLTTAYQRGDHSSSTSFMLARALQSDMATLARFPSSYRRMWYAGYSPDGTRIVTTDDHNAQVWDAKTNARLQLLPHDGEVYQALYTPDGRLVTVSKTLRVWSPAGKLIRELKPPQAGMPTSFFVAALSPDGKSIAAMDPDGSLAQVWDLDSGEAIVQLPNVIDMAADLSFSADGRWLAITNGAQARVFDTRTWQLQSTIPDVFRLAFAPNAPLLLTGSRQGQLAIWAPSGKLLRPLVEHGDQIDAIAWSPDGQLVAAGGLHGLQQIYAASGAFMSTLAVHDSPILSLEFDRRSNLTVTGSLNGSIVVAEVASGTAVAIFENKGNAATAHFDATSQRVISASWDGSARVWGTSDAYRRWASPPVSKDCNLTTSEQPGRYVAAACKRRPTNVWDIASDRLVATLPMSSEVNGRLVAPVISRSMDRVAIARGATAEVYALPSGELLATIAHREAINALGFAREDLITGSVDGSLHLTRSNGATTEFPPQQSIDAIETLSDGRIIAADTKRQLRVYDREGGVLTNIQLPVRADSFRVSGTSVVVIPSFDEEAAPPVLIDLTGNRAVAQLDCHFASVLQARWTADHQILTAGDKVCRWDGKTGELLQSYEGSPHSLGDVTEGPGFVVAGDLNGKLWFWDPIDGAPLWSLPAHSSRIERVLWQATGSIETLGADGSISRWKLPDLDDIIADCKQHHCAMWAK